MDFKIIHEKHKCIGCGACTLYPGWEMKDNKAVKTGMSYKKSKKEGKETEIGEMEVETSGNDLEAAQSCPVSCIIIKNTKTGETLN